MDLTTDFKVVSGRRALAESLARRWDTDRGGLIDDPNYGTNLIGLLNDDYDDTTIPALLAAAFAEALKDERVISISGVASLDNNGVLTAEFTVVDGQGPFSLTLSVSDVSVDILQVGQ